MIKILLLQSLSCFNFKQRERERESVREDGVPKLDRNTIKKRFRFEINVYIKFYQICIMF